MIRLLCVVLLTCVALIGLSLRVSRDAGDLSEPVRRAVAKVTTLDLSAALPPVAVERIAAALTEDTTAPAALVDTLAAADVPLSEEAIPDTRFQPFVEAPPSAEEPKVETQPREDDALAWPGPEAEIDQEAWAALIRRMLAVYPRSSSDR